MSTNADPQARVADAKAATTVAAFFDLDGTLIPGSANIPLAKAAFAKGLVKKRELAVDLARGLTFVLFGASDERSATVRDRILRAVAGHPAAEVEALADDFLDDVVATVRPRMREILDRHRALGHDTVVISASPTEIVQRVATAVGMTYGAGTRAARDELGRYTGELAGPFCYKEGKAQVVKALAQEHGYQLSQCFGYSDSISDVPMLSAVGNPVAVNPDLALRHLAHEQGWRILDHGKVRGGVASLVSKARTTGRGVLAGLRSTTVLGRLSARGVRGVGRLAARRSSSPSD